MRENAAERRGYLVNSRITGNRTLPVVSRSESVGVAAGY